MRIPGIPLKSVETAKHFGVLLRLTGTDGCLRVFME